jgi:hypothetical protein
MLSLMDSTRDLLIAQRIKTRIKTSIKIRLKTRHGGDDKATGVKATDYWLTVQCSGDSLPLQVDESRSKSLTFFAYP